jgi:hypothetical protein
MTREDASAIVTNNSLYPELCGGLDASGGQEDADFDAEKAAASPKARRAARPSACS